MPSTITDYAEAVAELNEERRRQFYETLAFNLTISARAVWSEDTLSDAEKVEQLKRLNEIQHRILNKVRAIHSLSDIELVSTILQNGSDCSSIAGHVGWAIKQSFRFATKDSLVV